MRFDVAFGDSTQPLDIPDRNLLGVLEPPDLPALDDPNAVLDRVAADVADFIGSEPRVAVLVNDYTRPTPNSLILDRLEPLLDEHHVRYLICLGTHRPPTEDECRTILGPDFYDRNRERIVFHDCQDRARLFFKGKTSFGTDVWLNRELLWADRIVAVNSVEPHYFAGYTGGRKSFLPGVAGFDTICQNHNMTVRPGSGTFRLEGNPVHEDMVEAAGMVIRPVYSVQFVLDRHHRIHSIHHGDLTASFSAAAAECRRVFGLAIDRPAELVVSVLRSPYDINFYQSQRAVEFARPAVRDGGIQVTVSACRDGIGNDGYIRVFAGCQRAADLLQSTPEEHQLGWHKSARLAQIMSTVGLYTVVGVDEDTVRRVFMEPFADIQRAVDAALGRLGSGAGVYLIPDAGAVVPVVGS